MINETKKILKSFNKNCVAHLNSLKIPSRVGKHKLELSSRTLSDVIEKQTIDYMIDYFGPEKVQFKNWRGYDVIILLLDETVYVNIKTQEHNDVLEATWLFSASVVKELEKKQILEHLYCIKFDYVRSSGSFLVFNSAKVAGPLSEVELISYKKGDPLPCRLRAEFNGTHCHLKNSYYD